MVSHFFLKYNFIVPSLSSYPFCFRYNVPILHFPLTRCLGSIVNPTIWIMLSFTWGGRKYGNIFVGTKSTKSRELSIIMSVAAISLLSVFTIISAVTKHPFPIFPLSGENLISAAVLTQRIIMSAAIPRIFFIIIFPK